MVHILLLILKIIGWILLAIVCLIILLFCILLFTPLCYRVQAACDGEISDLRAKAAFSWLCHLIRGTIRYEDGKIHWEFFLAWKRFGSDTGTEAVEKQEKELVEITTKKPETKTQKEVPAEKTKAEVQKEPPAEKTKAEAQKDVPAEKTKAEAQKKVASKKPEAGQKKEVLPKGGKAETQKKNPLQTIRCTFEKIYANIVSLMRKKEILMDFLKDPVHQAAWKKLLAELKKLLRRLLPKRLNANVHYGFEDPALTGYVLAVISMLYPAAADSVEIHPDFEQKVIEGTIQIEGRLRFGIFAAMGIGLLADKNIRKTVIDIKNFNFHEGGEQ